MKPIPKLILVMSLICAGLVSIALLTKDEQAMTELAIVVPIILVVTLIFIFRVIKTNIKSRLK